MRINLKIKKHVIVNLVYCKYLEKFNKNLNLKKKKTTVEGTVDTTVTGYV